MSTERFRSSQLTCGRGPVEEDGIGDEDEQHGRVGGDVVGDGVLKALLTATHSEIRV